MAPQPSAPPSLPPSVEEAYRRKCIQLKNRTNEVEDANDAARLRLARIKRQVEKLRIERAFLLEQLAKRTSTNVEDSEGSPSPPPTASFFDNASEPSANPRKPKDKPLRIKKGHKKSSAPGDADSKANAGGGPASPTSETNSHAAGPTNSGGGGSQTKSRTNGVSKKSKERKTPFHLYCEEFRPLLEERNKDGDLDIEMELSLAWKDLADAEKDEYKARADKQKKSRESKAAEAEAVEPDSPKEAKPDDHEVDDSNKPDPQDDDVEMVNYDTEDQDTQVDKDGQD